ncbi:PQQ-binding-like beta-propeller repeat protein [Streptomyces boninensis]|uniref:outer membrane protein assembly factor BamB family protein n=1 Tax=Streptomyces boninensis TaxID=2039455 RepID=UPI003B21FAF2
MGWGRAIKRPGRGESGPDPEGPEEATAEGAQPEDVRPEQAQPEDVRTEDARPAPSGAGPADTVPDAIHRRRRRLRILAGAAFALAATVAAALLLYGPAEPSAEPTAKPDPVRHGDGWSISLPVRGDARCIVPDGSSVYCNGAGYDAIRIWAPNGRVLWKIRSAASGSAPAPDAAPLGVRPMGMAGMVYVLRSPAPGAPSAAAVVAGIDRRNGRQVWKQELADVPLDEHAAAVGADLVYARTEKDGAGLAGFDPETGRLGWSGPLPDEPGCTWGPTVGWAVLVCPPEPGDPAGRVRIIDAGGGDLPADAATVPRNTHFIGVRGASLYFAEYRPEDAGKPAVRYTRLHKVSGSRVQVSRLRAPATPARRPTITKDGVIVLQHTDGTVSVPVPGRTVPLTLNLRKITGADDRTVASWGRRLPAVAPTPYGIYVLTPGGVLSIVDPGSGQVTLRKKIALPITSVGAQPQLFTDGLHPVGLIGRQLFAVPEPEQQPGA